jgi:hypothetical protein
MKRNLLLLTLIFPLLLATGQSLQKSKPVFNIETEPTRYTLNDTLPAPFGLEAEVFDEDVSLTWFPPNSAIGDTLSWSTDTLYTYVGFGTAIEWEWAAKWDPEQLSAYNGSFLARVSFIPGDTLTSYSIRIWEGPGAQTLVLEQDVPQVIPNVWNEILLDEPIPINTGSELWVGIQTVQTDIAFPAGSDAGPAIEGYGDLFRSDSGTWQTATSQGLPYNWMIRALVTLPSGQLAPLSFNPLDGYNIYRNDSLIASLSAGTFNYTDENPGQGIYLYEVTALYDTLESNPDTAYAQVGGPLLTLLPDTLEFNLSAGNIASTDLLLINTGGDEMIWNSDQGAAYLSLEPGSATIPSGDTISAVVTFDATDFIAGNYTEQIVFQLNNLSFPEKVLVVEADISGEPQIDVNPASIDFGEVNVYANASQNVTFLNSGTDTLLINDIQASSDAFAFEFTPGFLVPQDSLVLEIMFSPTLVEEYMDTLMIYSSDPGSTNLEVILEGEGIVQPPLNLQGTLNENVVELTWLNPIGGEGVWLYYGDGEAYSAVGLGPGGTWEVASRWEPDQLVPFVGYYITRFNFFPTSSTSEYTFKIWVADSLAVEVYSQPISNPDSGLWNEVILASPYQINPGTEIWFGYEIDQPANEFPAGIDEGPSVTWYGDLVRIGDDGWGTLNDFGLPHNWSMQAFVSVDTNLAGPFLPLLPKPLQNSSRSLRNSDLSAFHFMEQKDFLNPVNRTLTGYNVYRDSQLLTQQPLEETVYYDTLNIAGTYQYEVTAVYMEGESQPAGPVTITIDSMQQLNAPVGWDPVSNNIFHNITVPQSISRQTGNVLMPGDWIGVFFRMDESLILAGMGHWNGETDLQIHAFPDHELTPDKDGFYEGEPFVWMIHRETDNEEFIVKATYDQDMPDYEGQYVHNGESRILSLTLESFGINERNPDLDFTMFPNPATTTITLFSKYGIVRTEIISGSGMIILSLENQGLDLQNIDIQNLENGIYFVRVYTKSGTLTKKLLVR